MNANDAGWAALDVEAGVWIRSYSFDGRATANCLVTRMADDRLMVISPACHMTEAGFEAIERQGRVGAIVANNGMHYLGLAEWAARFPDASVHAPRAAMARIRTRCASAPPLQSFDTLKGPLGGRILLIEAPSTRCGESVAAIRTGRGWVWFASDILVNMESIPGPLPIRLLFRWTDSGPGYRIFNLALSRTVVNRRAVLTWLSAEMALRPPALIVPAHGHILDHNGLARQTQDMIGQTLRLV